MRRPLLQCLGLGFVLLALPAVAAAQAAPPTQDQLWAEMMEGNAIFVEGTVEYAGLRPLRRAMAEWQAPPVSAVVCSDSRVMPEVLFARTVGELFVTRAAGNLVDTLDLGSLEFAVLNGWTSLIVVMGHSDCGAVKAALGPDPVPPAPPLPDAFAAVVTEIRKALVGFVRTGDPLRDLRLATDLNTRYVARHLPERSTLLRDRVASGKVRIVTAYYDVGTGKVEALP